MPLRYLNKILLKPSNNKQTNTKFYQLILIQKQFGLKLVLSLLKLMQKKSNTFISLAILPHLKKKSIIS